MSKIYELTLQHPAAYASKRSVGTITAIFAHVGAWRKRQGTRTSALRRCAAGTSTAEIALSAYLRAEYPKEYADSVYRSTPAYNPSQCL